MSPNATKRYSISFPTEIFKLQVKSFQNWSSISKKQAEKKWLKREDKLLGQAAVCCVSSSSSCFPADINYLSREKRMLASFHGTFMRLFIRAVVNELMLDGRCVDTLPSACCSGHFSQTPCNYDQHTIHAVRSRMQLSQSLILCGENTQKAQFKPVKAPRWAERTPVKNKGDVENTELFCKAGQHIYPNIFSLHAARLSLW